MFEKMLKDKNIFITGASRGLGQSMALTFAKEGANIFFNFASDDKGALETKTLLEKEGVKVETFKASVTSKKEMEDVFFKIKSMNIVIDILVNNAGVSEALPFPLQDEKDWKRIIDTNVNGIYNVTHTFLPPMIRARKGVILNIGSLAGEKMIAAPVHYCTSKAALKGLTASLSKEVGRYGIRVLCLAPGLLKEGVASNLPENLVEEYVEHISLRRTGEFEEVSKMAAFLISDFNSYMSGQSVVIAGGF